MIKIKNLTYNYDKRFSTLYNLNLDIKKDEKLILLNETGLESQTLFRLIAKQDKIQKGEILFHTKNLKDIKFKDLSICYITQKPYLLNKSVIKNLIYPLTIRGIKKQLAIEKATDILQEFDEIKLIDKKVKQLSYFEKIKVSIMRAYMREYELILIDDIFNFDENKNKELINSINKLIINKTAIIALKNNKNIDNFTNFKVFTLKNGILIK